MQSLAPATTRRLCALLVVVAALAAACATTASPRPAQSHSEPLRDTYSDTWGAVDALGRELAGYDQAGPPRKDRYVGIFYFLWLGEDASGPRPRPGPFDISKILATDPEAMKQRDSPLWGPIYAPHHWGESLFGYYQTDDDYVLRKHAQMLSDAGVDTLIFDVSNQVTYRSAYLTLLRVFSEVRQAGGKTPQVAFLAPFWEPRKVVRELFYDLYQQNLYPDLWFRWKGKPLILADPALVGDVQENTQQDTAAELRPNQTLGQTFRAKTPFDAAGGRFPTYATRNASVTLTLRQGGPGGRLMASQRFQDFENNAWLSVRLAKPLPSGNYYLEAGASEGKVGWWSHTHDQVADGEAFANGAPVAGDRTVRLSLHTEEGKRLRESFTFRKPQPDYFRGPTGPDMWSWLEVHPQHVYRNARGEKEQMSVGVAQNAVAGRVGAMSEPGARGRSYHRGKVANEPDAVLRGYNAAEQWERALQEDPQFIFITGWNEWIAGRFDEFVNYRAPVIFVDQFDHEHSRDIEPMKGGHGDLYYHQMASYIRRYKGVRRPPAASPPRAIRLDDFRAWDKVRPEFRDDAGDAARRDHPSYGRFTRYINRTGRNDIVSTRVTYDRENLYFYVRTREPLTPHTDPNWMLLFIDAGANPRTGWEGYDFLVNRAIPSSTVTVLEANGGGWSWHRPIEVPWRGRGNEMALTLRRSDLGLGFPKPVRLHFKWADNIQRPGDVDAFTLNGDSAPNGRFSFRYEGLRE